MGPGTNSLLILSSGCIQYMIKQTGRDELLSSRHKGWSWRRREQKTEGGDDEEEDKVRKGRMSEEGKEEEKKQRCRDIVM